ncbi:hypothetical protein EV195_101436 [Tenacibaculum skagerrakense]|uniref:Uncharacterized protein n=1 Tax=Tenacibaculum skagerrakense TaxID=186571 RepID=A0A4R2P2S4_9FLAO|nr:hypothetical protein [Tenacibaculum skagerrakense]TCP28274.1 hypothetical protein EV195_101436 [Tenacibaculum skagerrakense]
MKTLTNNYIFKALDAYPYDLEEAIEALTYALAYDEKNVMALCLMGRIYAERLHDFDKAKEYYAEAITENINAFHVYPHYINVLLWNDDNQEAERLIDFALTIKGADKGVLNVKKSQYLEKCGEYKKALKALKEAKRVTYNNDYLYTINQEKERIKGKMPKEKKKEKGKKEKKKKK